jgi:endonuclease YncB( thermonuclease family)
MADVVRFARARPRVTRFAPLPPRRRTRLPLPALVIGFVILLITYGGRIVAPAPTGTPQPLSAVRVIDGDTLHAGDQKIRLIGIDAPEREQTCRDAQGKGWACGLAAREQLAALVAHGSVTCAAQGHDRYGRTVAVCAAGDVADIGGALVREGYAVSFMDRDGRYLAEENLARDEGRGLWRGAFERPADWRRRHRNSG